ncbi:MAG: hypothetical protein HRU25_17715, partial [Psychrobium sp.]|nr:hypothetical protein [Psychrobium sp.]
QVGKYLVDHLIEENANVFIADIFDDKIKAITDKHTKVSVVDPNKVFQMEMDIYAPCAMGATLNDDSIPELKCAVVAGAADASHASYMVGGDNEEFVDFDGNGTFDGGNNLYNGVLCKNVNHNAGICSNKLVNISRSITILQSGSWARISLIESGLNKYAEADYFQSVNVAGSFKTVVAYVSDLHNGRLPIGTVISFETGNGQIIGPTSCTIANSSSFGITSCAVTVQGDTDVALQGTS